MSVRIITDSTTEISQEEAGQLNISVVPLRSIFGETEYLDGIDLTPEQFYTMLEESDELPTTSQPTPHDFEKPIREAMEAGQECVIITIAENLSGTYQSANIAKEKCGNEGVWVVDSESATLSQRLLVERAMQLRDEGKSAKEIADVLEEEKKSVRLLAAIDTLEYLYKGGRLSRTSAFAGTLMKVKPIVSLDQGEIKAVGKSRGTTKSHEDLLALVEKEGGIDFSKPFAIGYTGDREKFDRFEAMCREQYAGHEPIVGCIGSVIGTHAGPGAVAIFFFKQ